MPTGYTAIIGEKPDLTFEEFALKCARAMGACIMQRDDSGDEPPKLDKVESYHAERLAEAQQELEYARVHKTEMIEKLRARRSKAIIDHVAGIAKDEKLRQAYQTMLAKVTAWQPPTDDHVNFKKFMRDQIVESIAWDCGGTYHKDALQEMQDTPFDGEAAYTAELGQLVHDVEYHTKELAEDTKRTNERNKWKQDLFDSLKETAGV